jgi:hypothetical protein
MSLEISRNQLLISITGGSIMVESRAKQKKYNLPEKSQKEASAYKANVHKDIAYTASNLSPSLSAESPLWQEALKEISDRPLRTQDELEEQLVEVVSRRLSLAPERDAEIREFLHFIIDIDEDFREQIHRHFLRR